VRGDSISPAPWLLVAKPLREPFDDGSTVLVRDLVRSLPVERRLTYFGDPLCPVRDAEDEVIAKPSMGHAPTMRAKVGVLTTLLAYHRRQQPLHFCFTPNKITSSVLTWLRRLQPTRPMIQSLMSSHRVEDRLGMLAPLDRVVVLSRHTAGRLISAGFDPDRVSTIYPAVAPPTKVREARGAGAGGPRVLFAGDLDATVVDRLIALAQSFRDQPIDPGCLVIACRPKSEEDVAERERLRTALAGDIAECRAELHGTVPDMAKLIRGCSLQIFVADHLKRKVDLPLVLLEGMAMGVGLVSMDFAPINEIFEAACRRGQTVGAAVRDTAELVKTVGEVLRHPQRLEAWGREARSLVAAEFSLDTMAASYNALYVRLEADSPRPA